MEGMVGGIIGLVGAGLQASAQASQIEYEYAALNWQKQRAVQQDWFARAGRQDAFGNVTKYNPATNMWEVNLSPEQKQITDAQQREQLIQLTQDIPAQRKVMQAVQERAEAAKQPYNRAQLGYQYDQPPPPEALQSQLTGLMAVNNMIKSKADQALIMRSALRMGTGANPTEIIKAVSDQLGSNAAQRNMSLQARQQSLQEENQLQQQHQKQYGDPMQTWAAIMQQGGQVPPIPTSTIPQTLSAQIGQQQTSMANAFNQGTTGVGSVMQTLAQAAGKSPDLSSAVAAFAKMKLGGASSDGSGDGGGGMSTFGQSSYDNNPGYGTSGDF